LSLLATVIPSQPQIELKEITNSANKFPMIYIVEPMDETFDDDPESIMDRVSSLRLIALDEPDKPNWITDDYYQFVLNPMNNLLHELIQEIVNDGGFGKLGATRRIINHSDWGTIKTDAGHEKKIISDRTSGSEMRMSLPIKDALVCKIADDCQ